ncbi:beta-galactosidase GalB [Mangrovibacterium marinum]|uniref:Beta-galactosidase n=1 Tax=Mangrovibacterium marinum TaxID=1639118 RepID=A0A2T5C6T5_9BACT|nr:beta-galactosidase GalB [Mangrovibacterium marinum]PTN10667.1 beta-galactosidase [Mangrovibacterium marinum]
MMNRTYKKTRNLLLLCFLLVAFGCEPKSAAKDLARERISLNNGWTFYKYDSAEKSDSLIYDVRPEVKENNDSKDADSKPTEALDIESEQLVLKPWVLPTANEFIADSKTQHSRPEGNPGGNFPFVQADFDDSSWEQVTLPHDWAIKGPFFVGDNPEVGGGMGRLPSNGVGWYRKKLSIPAEDARKSIFLDIDGAMSYAIVWLNGKLVGGWPYGYNSWRVDLTPYLIPGGTNQLAIRVDNPNYSARWYPGGGIYRNVWLVKTNPVHIAHWGTFVKASDISGESAKLDLEVKIENSSEKDSETKLITRIFELDENGNRKEAVAGDFDPQTVTVAAGAQAKIEASIVLKNPKLWGPRPTQQPNLYVAVTELYEKDKLIDQYETRFGVRDVKFDPNQGVLVNGELIKIHGVNQHHDLGALGAAFNTRAAERQLEILREMGCNAIRMSHNPPAPELLELTDRMGFLVIDEIFDCWEMKKTPHDFHLIFPDWSEADTRAFIRRDRNCPSVIVWSFGNEVGEQYTAEEGAAVGQRLYDFVKEEDPTRPTITAMNYAKPYMELPKVADLVGLNYQGEGIRQDPMFEGTDRIRTAPQYPAFHKQFPEKAIISTESASALSTRGTYLFPVSEKVSAPVREGKGGNEASGYVSAYELYAVDFGSSADKVFAAQDAHPFVAGEFVWTGWDYIGEPTPYYSARSSYSGIIDLAGFPKDRYYLYQSRWRPDLPIVHILPHWNWPDRIGKVTPVHVFTSGDEVELFLNGRSQGKKAKGELEYRLRWDDVQYEPGELKAVAYKDGKEWAEQTIRTTGEAAGLTAEADRNEIKADGKDLAFVTVKVTDENGLWVRDAADEIQFSLEGPGEIVATDNGDPTDMNAFPSHTRKAFGGLCLVIVKAKPGAQGTIQLKAESGQLKSSEIVLQLKP